MKSSPEADCGGWTKPKYSNLLKGKSRLQAAYFFHGATWKCWVLKKQLCEEILQPIYPSYSRIPLWKAIGSHHLVPGFLILLGSLCHGWFSMPLSTHLLCLCSSRCMKSSCQLSGKDLQDAVVCQCFHSAPLWSASNSHRRNSSLKSTSGSSWLELAGGFGAELINVRSAESDHSVHLNKTGFLFVMIFSLPVLGRFWHFAGQFDSRATALLPPQSSKYCVATLLPLHLRVDSVQEKRKSQFGPPLCLSQFYFRAWKEMVTRT